MNPTLRALCLLSLAGCAGARLPDAGRASGPDRAPRPALVAAGGRVALEREAAPSDPVAPEPSPAVAIGSEYHENQGGTWLPPELQRLIASLEGTAGRPTRVTWIGGSAGRCDDLWRFRVLYGSYDAFANVSGFRSASAASACGGEITRQFGAGPGSLNHASGPLLVVFNRNVTAAQRAALVRALDELQVTSASSIPPRALPAGANPGLFQRSQRRPPPPVRRAAR